MHNYENRSDRYVIPHDELFLGHFQYTPRNKRHIKSTYASSSPATNGRIVVAWFGSQGIYAYDFAGGLRCGCGAVGGFGRRRGLGWSRGGCAHFVFLSPSRCFGQENTPVSIGGCTRVARWCVWLCPTEDKRGTNALANYYEHSAGLHPCDGSLRTGQTSNPRVDSSKMRA